jgi:uncharacterized small protein (DUF1192 family)
MASREQGDMMDEEELVAPLAPEPSFEIMSVEELENMIAELETRIAEAREMIAAKQGARTDANSYFKE